MEETIQNTKSIIGEKSSVKNKPIFIDEIFLIFFENSNDLEKKLAEIKENKINLEENHSLYKLFYSRGD